MAREITHIYHRGVDLRRRRRRFARDPAQDFAAGLRERWQTLPLSGQAAIVAAVLDHLIVNPGTRGLNRLDPGRLTPVWRV